MVNIDNYEPEHIMTPWVLLLLHPSLHWVQSTGERCHKSPQQHTVYLLLRSQMEDHSLHYSKQ